MAKFLNSEMQTLFANYKAAHPDELTNGQVRVCIGGGAGFIGSHIARALKAEVSYLVLSCFKILLC